MFCDSTIVAGLVHDVVILSVPSSSGNVLRHCQELRKSLCGRILLQLSVPSSSGNVLRLDHCAAERCAVCAVFQSPPHRGMFCDEQRLGSASIHTNPFQSPPHRGMFCDCSHDRQRARSDATAFSPLLIGECLCDASTPTLPAHSMRIDLSVPSSSGMSLRLSLCYSRQLLADAPFSPLLIGDVSATRAAFDCELAGR